MNTASTTSSPSYKLGIIGGAGPYASSLLYQKIIEKHYRLGRPVPEIRLINFPFTRGLNLSESRTNESILLSEVRYCIEELLGQQVDMGILACNTLHLYLEKTDPCGIRFHHLPRLVHDRLAELNYPRTLLLSTETTASTHLYRSSDAEIVYLLRSEGLLVSDVIDRVLEGRMERSDSVALQELVSRYRDVEGIEAVILGCTELPVLHDRHPFLIEGVEVIDTLDLAAEAALTSTSRL